MKVDNRPWSPGKRRFCFSVEEFLEVKNDYKKTSNKKYYSEEAFDNHSRVCIEVVDIFILSMMGVIKK